MDLHSMAVARARMSEAEPMRSVPRSRMDEGEDRRGSLGCVEKKLGRAGTAVSKLILHLKIAVHFPDPNYPRFYSRQACPYRMAREMKDSQKKSAICIVFAGKLESSRSQRGAIAMS